ncbi:MAG: metalloregulator ArsR/SmtB family transcription factor [Dehalococcoidia bacterium]|nr:metalloregulator ArsR/SmtB family transcription factor [Dehalococcoidia bacterium]
MSAFEVVAEPARRALLDALVDGPRSVGELVAITRLSQPNTSRHLRVLREAGFVTREAAGQRRLYRLRPERLADLPDAAIVDGVRAAFLVAGAAAATAIAASLFRSERRAPTASPAVALGEPLEKSAP